MLRDETNHIIITNTSTSSSSPTPATTQHEPSGSTGDESDVTNRETNTSPGSESESGVFTFGRTLRAGTYKTVCFHSETCHGEKRITNALDCLQHMINGTTLIKVKASTRQYRRFFTLEEDLSAVRWLPSSKKSSKARLSIKSVKEVRPGKTTEVMKNREIAAAYSDDCSFSIIFGEDFDSLDLIALTPEEANIWITGLNFLMGASKSPDPIEGREKMREKWLHQVFDQADAEQKGMLDEWETIALMKKLNDKLCIESLKQKIMEFGFGKDEEERGRISKTVFMKLFTETATRPDIYFILVRYCGRDYMTVEELQLFLEGEQGVCDLTLEDCENLILKYEPSEEARQKKQLNIDGFTQLLLSEECDIMPPSHYSVVHDMSQPLTSYFISCSHNTYLLEDQLKGPSSCEGYERALLQGCRCIKIDCWDGTEIDAAGNPIPVVYHGNTLTTKVPLEEVLESINSHAFVMSEFPLIIHLENHCCLEQQRIIATQLKSVFASSLYIPSTEDSKSEPLIPSQIIPSQWKRKIILKGKKMSHSSSSNRSLLSSSSSTQKDSNLDCDNEVSDEDDSAFPSVSTDHHHHHHHPNNASMKRMPICKELSDLIALTRIRLADLSEVQSSQAPNEVNCFHEAIASKLALTSAEELAHHNKLLLTHVSQMCLALILLT